MHPISKLSEPQKGIETYFQKLESKSGRLSSDMQAKYNNIRKQTKKEEKENNQNSILKQRLKEVQQKLKAQRKSR
jgi:hypothetical protein